MELEVKVFKQKYQNQGLETKVKRHQLLL